MKKYLIDTNIAIFYMKGKFDLETKFDNVLPENLSLDLYGKEKARLRKAGTPIDDFDLLIGVTSVTHKLIMVTNNSNHFKRITGIKLENWTATK